jgi:hypothetical protein
MGQSGHEKKGRNPVSTKPRLEELAATVAREHQLVRGAASAMLEHAMSAGDALIEAEREVERGGFLSWLAVSLPHLSQSTATKYMCVARNRERVTESGAVSIREAMSLLREDGILGRPSLDLNVAVLDSVRAGEISERDAAKTLGVARSTVRRKLNPAVARKQSRDSARQRKQARRALRDQARAGMARELGGPLGAAYAFNRQTLGACQQGIDKYGGRARLHAVHAYDKAREADGIMGRALEEVYHLLGAQGAEDDLAKAAREAA